MPIERYSKSSNNTSRRISTKQDRHQQRKKLAKLYVKTSEVQQEQEQEQEQHQQIMNRATTSIERSMMNLGSIAIYQVQPVKDSLSTGPAKNNQSFTLYAVNVQNAISGRSWVVYRRYNDFDLLRQKLQSHFRCHASELPQLFETVEDLYFPRKHKIRSNTKKVKQHRANAFLHYLTTVQKILISYQYLHCREISQMGLSIFRGFLGSSCVIDASHREYNFAASVPQRELKPSERVLPNQCGALMTVVEENQEDIEEEEEAYDLYPAKENDNSDCSLTEGEEDEDSFYDLDSYHDSSRRSNKKSMYHTLK